MAALEASEHNLEERLGACRAEYDVKREVRAIEEKSFSILCSGVLL